MRRWAIAAGFAFAAAALPLRGVSFVWTGLALDNDTSNGANWRGGVAPPGDGTADLTFGPTANISGAYSYLYFGTNQSLNSLAFSGAIPPYYIEGTSESASVITILSGLTYAPTSTVDSLLTWNINLAAANAQTWNISNGSLEIDGNITGSATITKSGTGELRLYTYANTFSGTIVLNQGGLLLGYDSALGSGKLTINGSNNPYLKTDSDNAVTINNPVTLNGGSFQTLLNSTLTLSGTVTLAANTTIAPQTVQPLVLAGTVTESGGSRSLTVDGPGVVSLTGTNSYTGGTNVSDGVVIFGAASSIPTTGQLTATGDGYIGIVTPPSNLQSSFIDRFDKANTTGTIGLDATPGTTTTSANYFQSSIDLTGFAAGARLGSATNAELGNYNKTITPSGTVYNFGGGGGRLQVDIQLTDGTTDLGTVSRSVVVNSPASAPLTLRLIPGTDYKNNYSGGTTATQSAVIFGSGGLPVSGTGDLHLGPGGYIGLEDISDGTTLWAFLNRFPTTTSQGVIGFDSSTSSAVSIGFADSSIYLGNFSNPTFYLGTATKATISDAIMLPSTMITGAAYRFAGYKGGQLEVSSSLSDNMGYAASVIIGDPDVPATANDPTQANSTEPSSVKLSGDNSYTGGTTLYAGRLIVSQSNDSGTTDALGATTGALTVQPVNFTHDSSLRPTLQLAASNVANPIVLNADLNLTAWADTNYTLAGAISGTGALYIDTTPGTITLGSGTGDAATINTFSGGVHIGTADNSGGTVIFATDHAAGSGTLDIVNGEAKFTSANPVIGGLSGSDEEDPLYLAYGVQKLTIDQGADSHYYGEIESDGEGNAALVKTGGGNLYLESYNSYRGGTTINAGAIVAGNNHALGSGTVTIDGGKLALESGVTLSNDLSLLSGTLGGSGTFDPPNRPVISSVVIAPGSISLQAPGTLSFGSNGLAFASGGGLHWQIQSATGAAGIGYDTLAIAGVLDVTSTTSGTFKISIVSLDADGNLGAVGDFDAGTGQQWLIADATDGITINGLTPTAGFDPSPLFYLDTQSFANSLDGGTFNLSLGGDSTELFLNFTPVPEPSTAALLGLGLAGLLLRCWRRRR